MGPKWPICLEQIFLYKPLLLLSSICWPFSLCKIQKDSYSGSRVIVVWCIFYYMMFMCGCQIGVNVPFLGPKWSIYSNFFLENYKYHFHLPISPFQSAKFFKKSSSGSRVMRIHNFWAQNGPFPQMRLFSENLLIRLVSFIHSYLHAKNWSQILIY